VDDELRVASEGLEFLFCRLEEHALPIPRVVVEGGERQKLIIRKIFKARYLGLVEKGHGDDMKFDPACNSKKLHARRIILRRNK
jgi:hypothetical protein